MSVKRCQYTVWVQILKCVKETVELWPSLVIVVQLLRKIVRVSRPSSQQAPTIHGGLLPTNFRCWKLERRSCGISTSRIVIAFILFVLLII